MNKENIILSNKKYLLRTISQKMFLLFSIGIILSLFPFLLWASEEKGRVSKGADIKVEPAFSLKPKLVLKKGLLSMDLKEADFRGVLREIGRQAGIKVLVDKDLEKKVTVKFDNIPLREGLERILKGENYFLVFHEGKINPVRSSDGTLDPPLPHLFRESSSMTSRSRPSNGVKEVRIIGKGKERNLVVLYSPEPASRYGVQRPRETPWIPSRTMPGRGRIWLSLREIMFLRPMFIQN